MREIPTASIVAKTEKSSKIPHDSVGSDYDNQVPVLPDENDKDEDVDSKSSPHRDIADISSISANGNNNNTSDVKQELLPSIPSNSSSKEPETQLSLLQKHITETVTKNIQNLLQAAQKNKVECYLPCSQDILTAVQYIRSSLLKDTPNSKINDVVLKLESSAVRLRDRCNELPENSDNVNSKQFTEEIIKSAAYEIAKAAKELVTITTKAVDAAPS